MAEESIGKGASLIESQSWSVSGVRSTPGNDGRGSMMTIAKAVDAVLIVNGVVVDVYDLSSLDQVSSDGETGSVSLGYLGSVNCLGDEDPASRQITHIETGGNGRMMWVITAGGEIGMWRLKRSILRGVVEGFRLQSTTLDSANAHPDSVTSLVSGGDSDTTLYVGTQNGFVFRIDAPVTGSVTRTQLVQSDEGAVGAMCWRAVSGLMCGIGAEVVRVDGSGWKKNAMSEVRALQWSPNGAVVLSGHNDGRVRAWDAKSGDLVQVYLPAHGLRASEESTRRMMAENRALLEGAESAEWSEDAAICDLSAAVSVEWRVGEGVSTVARKLRDWYGESELLGVDGLESVDDTILVSIADGSEEVVLWPLQMSAPEPSLMVPGHAKALNAERVSKIGAGGVAPRKRAILESRASGIFILVLSETGLNIARISPAQAAGVDLVPPETMEATSVEVGTSQTKQVASVEANDDDDDDEDDEVETEEPVSMFTRYGLEERRPAAWKEPPKGAHARLESLAERVVAAGQELSELQTAFVLFSSDITKSLAEMLEMVKSKKQGKGGLAAER